MGPNSVFKGHLPDSAVWPVLKNKTKKRKVERLGTTLTALKLSRNMCASDS